jgi:hypothetical protein
LIWKTFSGPNYWLSTFFIPCLDDHAAAIMEAQLPGKDGNAAISDLLFGMTNPGG